MSIDIVDMVKSMENLLELQLVLQCAPVISNIKISNLLTLPQSKLKSLKKLLRDTELSYRIIYPGKSRLVILVYREEALKEYIRVKEIADFLKGSGYDEINLIKILRSFVKRYIAYMDGIGNFPHELGLFLGYPLCDVEGFIENDGKNFLYSGYWKVYKNVEEKIALFKSYEEVQTKLVIMVYSGIPIKDILSCNK